MTSLVEGPVILFTNSQFLGVSQPRNTPKLWNTQKLSFVAVKGTLMCFHAKIGGPSSKIDWVMTILMIFLIFKIFQFLDSIKIVKCPGIFQISIFFENSNVQHLRLYYILICRWDFFFFWDNPFKPYPLPTLP